MILFMQLLLYSNSNVSSHNIYIYIHIYTCVYIISPMIKQLLSKALSPYRTFIIYNKNINHLCAFFIVLYHRRIIINALNTVISLYSCNSILQNINK